MKYKVITINQHPAVVKSDDMDGETLKECASYAPFGFEMSAYKACDALNSGGTEPSYFEWQNNNPTTALPNKQ